MKKKIVVTKNLSFYPDQLERIKLLWEVILYDKEASSEEEWLSRCQWAEIICSWGFGFKSNQLYKLKNVFIHGGFHYDDLPSICLSFRVGLLPYLNNMSHDGSPLKLYEYLRYCRPVITSIDYEITDHKYIINYQSKDFSEKNLSHFLELAGSGQIASLLDRDDYLSTHMLKILEES